MIEWKSFDFDRAVEGLFALLALAVLALEALALETPLTFAALVDAFPRALPERALPERALVVVAFAGLPLGLADLLRGELLERETAPAFPFVVPAALDFDFELRVTVVERRVVTLPAAALPAVPLPGAALVDFALRELAFVVRLVFVVLRLALTIALMSSAFLSECHPAMPLAFAI